MIAMAQVQNRVSRRLSIALTASVLAGIAVYLGRHANEVRDLAAVRPGVLLAAATVVLRVATVGWINRGMLRAVDIDVKVGEIFWLSAVTVAGNLLVPFQAGTVFRAKYLHERHALAYSRFVVLLLGMQLLLFAASSLVATISLVVLFPIGRGLPSDAALVASAACLAGTVAVIGLSSLSVPRWPRVAALESATQAWRALRARPALAARIFVGCALLRGCEATCFWMLSSAVGLSYGPLAAIALTSVAAIPAHVGVTLGGIGIYEGTICMLSESFGLTVVQGLTVSLMCRALVAIVSVSLALPGCWGYFTGRAFRVVAHGSVPVEQEGGS